LPDPSGSPGPDGSNDEPRRNVVLITRPEPGASETARRLAALGFIPVLCPLLQIRPVPVTLPAASAIAAVLLTSGAAIPFLPSVYHETPLLAVGDATADRARKAGFSRVRSASGDAEALAAQVRQSLAPEAGPLLLAAGKGNGKQLASFLRDAGYRVLRRVVYAAVPTPDLAPDAVTMLRAGRVRTALFFSTETARHFVRLVRTAELAASLHDVEAVAIGRLAGVALQVMPWRHVRVAARPNQDEMLELL
jgi:uroporphyrinogen-III synthase